MRLVVSWSELVSVVQHLVRLREQRIIDDRWRLVWDTLPLLTRKVDLSLLAACGIEDELALPNEDHANENLVANHLPNGRGIPLARTTRRNASLVEGLSHLAKAHATCDLLKDGSHQRGLILLHAEESLLLAAVRVPVWRGVVRGEVALHDAILASAHRTLNELLSFHLRDKAAHLAHEDTRRRVVEVFRYADDGNALVLCLSEDHALMDLLASETVQGVDEEVRNLTIRHRLS